MMVTSVPRRRRYQAVDRPMIPAPTTMTLTASPSGGMIRIRSGGRLLRPLSLVGRLPRTPLLYDHDHTDATAHYGAPDEESLREARLAEAKLYLCTDARTGQGDLAEFLDAAYRGGVDIIQLRDKSLEARAEIAALRSSKISPPVTTSSSQSMTVPTLRC